MTMDTQDSNDLKLFPIFAQPIFDIGANSEYFVNPVGNSSWIYAVASVSLLEELIRQRCNHLFLNELQRKLSNGFQPWKLMKDLHQRVLDSEVQLTAESMASFTP